MGTGEQIYSKDTYYLGHLAPRIRDCLQSRVRVEFGIESCGGCSGSVASKKQHELRKIMRRSLSLEGPSKNMDGPPYVSMISNSVRRRLDMLGFGRG